MKPRQVQFDFSGTNVLVTGCQGQLGMQLVQHYLASGAKVVGFDLHDPNEQLRNSENFQYLNVDITKKEQVTEAFQTIRTNIGTIGILINNAAYQIFGNFEARQEIDFEDVVNVNLKGSFYCMSSFAQQPFVDRKNLSIVNISSIYGVVSPDFRIYEEGDRYSSEVYGASKAGLIQMTRYFAICLAEKGIRVNSISPGGIFNSNFPQSAGFVRRYSDRVPLRRMAVTTEITDSIMFLTSDAASYITGHNLIVDGGLTAW